MLPDVENEAEGRPERTEEEAFGARESLEGLLLVVVRRERTGSQGVHWRDASVLVLDQLGDQAL